MLLSQVCKLNAAVAICRYFPVRRYLLIKVYAYDVKKFGPVPLGLKRCSTINGEKNSIKARINCLFISKTTIMVNKREKTYFIIPISDRQLSSLFLSLILSLSF